MVADYDGVLVTLTAEVANLYILARTFEERLIHARENVKIQQRSFEITDVRFRNGATTELDVRQAKNALCTLLAMPPNDLQEIMGAAGTIPMTPSQIAVGIPE
jgi:outer membrane protein TolC